MCGFVTCIVLETALYHGNLTHPPPA
ncbi:hypothetical protein GMOD_00004122 [Pyrenophora seminiperda CCB06]|uniref:Uncharacterized protein n=1 Tax=Pyrenophora seminiperda CCB06 TaxID=1302712 RepID=A0A3M7M0N8_9PLEO|nr:hypothetical protein GMOD_00004122 [Pyrenophora seminiperda CCB06]